MCIGGFASENVKDLFPPALIWYIKFDTFNLTWRLHESFSIRSLHAFLWSSKEAITWFTSYQYSHSSSVFHEKSRWKRERAYQKRGWVPWRIHQWNDCNTFAANIPNFHPVPTVKPQLIELPDPINPSAISNETENCPSSVSPEVI